MVGRSGAVSRSQNEDAFAEADSPTFAVSQSTIIQNLVDNENDCASAIGHLFACEREHDVPASNIVREKCAVAAGL